MTALRPWRHGTGCYTIVGVDELLERGAELEQLGTAIAEAKSGRGSMVLIFGEAGIGKTSLVRAFARRLHGVKLLAGACDDLLTPRRRIAEFLYSEAD